MTSNESAKTRFQFRATDWFLPLVIVAILVAMALIEPRFFSRLNITNVLRNFAVIAFVALGQGMVMIVGGFDLSVGAALALSSVVSATAMLSISALVPDSVGLIIAGGFVAGLLSCAVVGLINGLLVARLKASPFIITLGTMSALLGMIYYHSKGTPIYGLPKVMVKEIGRGRFLDLPIIFYLAILAIGIVWFLMTQMRFGKHVYAVGSNSVAAFESGINSTRILVTVYAMSSVLAGIAGLILTSRLGAGQSGIGTNAAIESIAAAVIAGVSLRGGIGSIPRIAVAALFLAIVANSLNLAQIDSKYQTMVLGFFLIGAIALENRLNRQADYE